MNTTKSPFWYDKSQRNGILYLSTLIIVFQLAYYFIDFSSDEIEDLNTSEIGVFQRTIDSLKLIEIERRKPKIYPFNPSFITDYKGYKLGMSVQEIDKLLAYRKTGKYINSTKEFQKVTGVSDSLLRVISPYFKFPEWLNTSKTKKRPFTGIKKELNLATKTDLQEINGVGEKLSARIIKFRNSIGGYQTRDQLQKVYGLKPEIVTAILNRFYIKSIQNKPIVIKDINTATVEDLKKVNGIGEKLSARIVKFRQRIGGFYFEDQLNDVYGLEQEVINNVWQGFKIISKPNIKKININEATFKEVLHLPYIDYELTKKIFNYRDEFAEFQRIEELKKIKDFPLDKYDRIILYLKAE